MVGDWNEWIFQMCWHQHGGSGLGFTMNEVLNLPVDECWWYIERIWSQRNAEAEEIRKATKGK